MLIRGISLHWTGSTLGQQEQDTKPAPLSLPAIWVSAFI